MHSLVFVVWLWWCGGVVSWLKQQKQSNIWGGVVLLLLLNQVNPPV